MIYFSGKICDDKGAYSVFKNVLLSIRVLINPPDNELF